MTFDKEIVTKDNLSDLYLSTDKEGSTNTKDSGLLEIVTAQKDSNFSIKLSLNFLTDSLEREIYI